MFHGQFESLSLIESITPTVTTKPIAWGMCTSTPETYFFISNFHDMKVEDPDVKSFCARIAHLHLKSADLFEMSVRMTPEERFGFHMTTYFGIIPQDNHWCESWEAFYIQGLHPILALEESIRGPSEEMRDLAKQLIEKVIPRLLRPLDTGGRTIRPTLVHGDLHFQNAGTDRVTELPVIFDACSFWSHNECKHFN